MKTINQSVEIFDHSFNIINEIYSMYTKSENPIPKEINGWCVIHTYPIKDTITNEDGNCEGYQDSLFFNIKVFDCENKIYYSPTKEYDGLFIKKDCRVTYFKDLSVMYVFHNGVKIGNFQALELY